MRVFINTVAFELPNSRPDLSYEEIVRLAKYVGTPNVTFHGTEESEWRGGILHPGETVVCRHGTKIKVALKNKITWNNDRYENSDGTEAYCSCGGVPHCTKYNRDGRNIGLALAIVAGIDSGLKSKVHTTNKPKDLPTPCELLLARDWLYAGCPAYPIKRFGEVLDPKVPIDVLCKLLDALPSHFPQYCHGTPEHKAAMISCQEDEERSWDGDGNEADT